jgi:hypothetical protein
MAMQVLGGWIGVMGGYEPFEKVYDADPLNDLSFPPSVREAFLKDCKAHFMAAADEAFKPYGIDVHGNGDLYQDLDGEYLVFDDDAKDYVRELLGMVDYDEIIKRWDWIVQDLVFYPHIDCVCMHVDGYDTSTDFGDSAGQWFGFVGELINQRLRTIGEALINDGDFGAYDDVFVAVLDRLDEVFLWDYSHDQKRDLVSRFAVELVRDAVA